MSTDDEDDEDGVRSWLRGGSLKPGKNSADEPPVHEHVVWMKAGSVTTSTSAVQVTLSSVGVDSADMLAAMRDLGEPTLTALRERALLPDEVKLPLPSGLPRERLSDVAAAFAYAILDGRTHERQEESKAKDRRVALWGAVLGALAGGGILGYLIKWLSG